MRTFHIEELRTLIGEEVIASEWMVVDQARIDRFAEATGDHQWIHKDVERARAESPYGGTIAHGFLTLSLVSLLSQETFVIEGPFKMRINYGLNRVRFPAAVAAGTRVRARFTLLSLDEIEGGHQLSWAVTMDAEGSAKPALYAEWVIRLYR
jgi:acyl dehydratase